MYFTMVVDFMLVITGAAFCHQSIWRDLKHWKQCKVINQIFHLKLCFLVMWLVLWSFPIYHLDNRKIQMHLPWLFYWLGKYLCPYHRTRFRYLISFCFFLFQVSQKLSSFLDSCLQKDPLKRATAFELLQHPFLKLATSPANISTLIKEYKQSAC